MGASRTGSMAAKPQPGARTVPERVRSFKWIPTVVLAWLVPGAGHFYLRRPIHGAILLAAIAGMFLTGLAMNGRMFTPMSGDLFTTIMTYGGYIGDLCSGSLYFVTIALGYEQEILPGAGHDYGTKFIVCAGFLNLLAIVDAYEHSSVVASSEARP